MEQCCNSGHFGDKENSLRFPLCQSIVPLSASLFVCLSLCLLSLPVLLCMYLDVYIDR